MEETKCDDVISDPQAANMNRTERKEREFNPAVSNDAAIGFSRTDVSDDNSRTVVSTPVKTDERGHAQQRSRDVSRTFCGEKITNPKKETSCNVKTPCLQLSPKTATTSRQAPCSEVQRNNNSDLTVERMEEEKTKGVPFSSPSSSADRKWENANDLQRKVQEQGSLESTAEQERTKSGKSKENQKPMESPPLDTQSASQPPGEDCRHAISKPDTRTRLQKLLARRRGEVEKPFRRVVIVKPFNIASVLDARLSALERAIARDFHDDVVMARQVLMPRLFQRLPKLRERWKLTHDVRLLQEVLVGLHSARERREEERQIQQRGLDNTEASILLSSEDQSSDELVPTDGANTPESSNGTSGQRVESPRQASHTDVSPSVTAVALVHADGNSEAGTLAPSDVCSDVVQADDNDVDNDDRSGDKPETGTSPEPSGQRTSAGLPQERKQNKSKVGYAKLNRDHVLVRSYTALPFQPSTTAPSTASAGKKPAILEQRSQNPAQSAAPGRLRRTVTSLSVASGRMPAPVLSKAMRGRIQDVQQIYGSQR